MAAGVLAPGPACAADTESAPLAPAALPVPRVWAARVPRDPKVAYRGAVSFDGAGAGTGAMLYPAPGLIGMLAAVATHAVIVNGVRSSEKTKLQERADEVLVPYREVLATLDSRDLLQRALGNVAPAATPVLLELAAPPGDAWVVDSVLGFVMTQDQRAIVLENSVAVSAPNAPAKPVYQNLVRVVSSPEPADDVAMRWNADGGAKLRERSAQLLAQSLAIAIDAAATAPAQATVGPRTFRYAEGGIERMERAQLVSAGCGRVVIRTLRGWLMSVPLRPDDVEGGSVCRDDELRAARTASATAGVRSHVAPAPGAPVPPAGSPSPEAPATPAGSAAPSAPLSAGAQPPPS